MTLFYWLACAPRQFILGSIARDILVSQIRWASAGRNTETNMRKPLSITRFATRTRSLSRLPPERRRYESRLGKDGQGSPLTGSAWQPPSQTWQPYVYLKQRKLSRHYLYRTVRHTDNTKVQRALADSYVYTKNQVRSRICDTLTRCPPSGLAGPACLVNKIETELTSDLAAF